MTRRGFTLTELLIAMVVMGLLGTVMARILINNSRFVSRQDAMMESRSTARAAMQAVVTELHMVPDGGLQIATRDSIRVAVPYAFGMLCGTTPPITTASLMPADSLMVATAVPDTIGIRNPNTGIFARRRVTSVSASPAAADCTNDSIKVTPGGQLIGMTIPGFGGSSGSLFYLSQTVTYAFKTSVDVPGRRGLWRRVGTGAYEELAAPFDTTARFAFLMHPLMGLDTRATLPASARDSVRGIELRLTGASVNAPQGASTPQTFDLQTTVAFMNKAYVGGKAVY